MLGKVPLAARVEETGVSAQGQNEDMALPEATRKPFQRST